MSDFLSDVLEAGRAVIAREVTVGGKKGTVHFRRITAGQRQELLQGQKVSAKAVSNFELDLALNEEQKQRMVLFCTVKEDGTPYFGSIEVVKGAPSDLVQALYQVAAHLDAQEQDAGKA